MCKGEGRDENEGEDKREMKRKNKLHDNLRK